MITTLHIQRQGALKDLILIEGYVGLESPNAAAQTFVQDGSEVCGRVIRDQGIAEIEQNSSHQSQFHRLSGTHVPSVRLSSPTISGSPEILASKCSFMIEIRAGSQQLRMVAYFRPDGSDMDYWVIASDVVTIPAGTAAGWVRFPIPFTYLIPGSYDLAIESGPNTGVARYYVDGSETNWTGFSQPFAAPPPSYYQRQGYSNGSISESIEYTSSP